MKKISSKESQYFEHTKNIIDPNIHKFLYVLVKYLFFGKKIMSIAKDKLHKIIDKLKLKNLKIEILDNNTCNATSFEAILEFIKTQNFALASEILENIIIRVLIFAFIDLKSDEFFGKYLYNNLDEFKKNKNIFLEWIDTKLLKSLFNETNKDLQYALEKDDNYKNFINSGIGGDRIDYYKICKQSTFLQILYSIFASKNFIDNKKENSNSNNKTNTTTIITDKTSIYTQLSNLYFEEEIGQTIRDQPLSFSSSILISAYIYHQNRYSPLMNYSEGKNNLENLTFKFELSEAGINDIYLDTILSPIRMEPRVTEIELNKNRINIFGMFELHKLLIFNKNIETISIKDCAIKSKYLNTFNNNYALFNNYNVENLDISSNYLKSDADTNLSKLIIHLKGINSLVLSFNKLKSGLGSFFVTLKNLYRKNQTKLEELYLINCELDDISFYELGELLKSKYCKLKCLCLNENIIPSDINFFKALKKNRSLEEIYFYGCGINSEKTDEIERLINNTNLQSLYLYTNKIHDFNQYLRIIYKTTLIKNEKEKNKSIFINNPTLFNLNMNNTDCYNQNKEKLDILFEGIKNTNLTVLDLSSVLKKNKENTLNFYYYLAVIELIKYLDIKQEKYKKAKKEFNLAEINIKKYNKKLEDKDKKEFEKFNSDIQNIIRNSNFKFDKFVNEKVREIISRASFKNKEEKLDKLSNYFHLKINEILFNENQKILEKKKMILI